jgi:hypothetical protein
VDDEHVVGTTLPHSSFGAPDCCGCLNAIVGGNQAEIICNECDRLVRTVPVSDLQKTLDDMELTLELSSAVCPTCGTVNLFPGFSKIMAFTCKKCGQVVKLTDDPEIDRLFGYSSSQA